MIENINFKVSVRCMTYNQAAYIEDAMNGFCMQQTDFPFVCNVMDDASTDGEQNVIRKYLEEHFDLDEKNLIKKEETDDYKLIFARHKENKNCYFAVYFLKYNHYGSQESKNKKLTYFSEWESNVDYIALCEGDDYWIDSLKLQKQVDFFQKHHDCSMCFHRAVVLKENDVKTILECDDIEDRIYTPDELLECWKVPTASIIMKKDVLYVKKKGVDRVLNSDIVIVLDSAKLGNVWGMSTGMSVYRMHNGGVTYDQRLANIRVNRYPDHFKFIKDNYPFIKSSIINKKIGESLLNRRRSQKSLRLYMLDLLSGLWYFPKKLLIKNMFIKIFARKFL